MSDKMHLRTVFVVPGEFRVHHCAKVGSTSIADAIRSTPGCTGGREVTELGHEYRWAVVRHPLDRLVSSWAHFCFRDNLRHQPEMREIGYTDRMGFREFLDVALTRSEENQHTRGQFHSLGPHKFDRIGRLENLSAEWSALRRRFPIIAKDIGHTNKASHDPWQTYYTKKLRIRAEKVFARDLALFEASSPNPPME